MVISPTQLRSDAEALLARGQQGGASALPADELLHELQVHQIELEMQNESLRQVLVALEESRDRYVDLYEFAPVGYLTLTDAGLIAEINLTGAALLGMERGKLLNRRFAHFVLSEDRDRWQRQFMKVKAIEGKRTFTLGLKNGDGDVSHIQFDCLRSSASDAGSTLRMALTDISERKQAEDALRDSDEILHNILETTLDGYWRIDGHGNLLDANKVYSQQSGYTREELLELRVSDLEVVESAVDTAVHLLRIVERRNDQFETMHRRKDGSIWHVEVSVTYRDVAGGQFFVFMRDITARKQLKAALLDSEERYSLIFKMSEDAILLTQPEEDRILTANPAACRMFEYSQEEICNLGRAAIIDVVDTRWSSLLAERSRKGHVHSRIHCIKSNGDVFPVEFSSILFHDSKRNLLAAVHFRDISAQERAEKELRDSEMRWQFAVESHGDAMWDWDADKDELFLTAAAKELFNLPDTNSKRSITDLTARVLDEDRALMQKQIDDILADKTSEWMGESRLSWFGGTQRWITTRGRVMTRTADGRPHRIVSISRDITQRIHRDAEARRQRALVAHQGRLVLLGELASALSHEINQPLTAISGFAASCARKTAKTPEVLELVRAIEEQAMRAGEIAWRMRGFARRQSIGRRALSLHEVTAGVAKWIRMDSAQLDVVIDVTGVGSSLPQVDADRVELEQVLVNLVRNGIEAALPNAKEQRIVIDGGLGEHPDEIEVTVTDWGCGFPATEDIKAFQPFTSTKEQGLGLGLSICFSIIEGHGGHLWATPNPEGGTIFHFTLPVASGLAAQTREEEIPVTQLPLAFPEN